MRKRRRNKGHQLPVVCAGEQVPGALRCVVGLHGAYDFPEQDFVSSNFYEDVGTVGFDALMLLKLAVGIWT